MELGTPVTELRGTVPNSVREMLTRATAAIGSCAMTFALFGATRGPVVRPYEVLLYGTVRAVNATARTVTIAYAPLETEAGGIRSMRVFDPVQLEGLRRGDPVQAIADTRRTPWTVRGLRRMR
jgi:Cu/Ag efflux protein CusF